MPKEIAELELLNITQVTVAPQEDTGDTPQLKITAYVDRALANFELLIPSGAAQAYDFKELLSETTPVWMAKSLHAPKSPLLSSIDFVEKNGSFVAELSDPKLNEVLNNKLIHFREAVQALVDFGFNQEVIFSTLLSRKDARYTHNFNYLSVEGFFTLPHFKINPFVTILSTKLVDSNSVKVSFSISNPLDHSDFITIDATALFAVDYKTQKLEMKRIITQDLNYLFFDEEDQRHFSMSLEHFIENLDIEEDEQPLLDFETANEAIKNIIGSEVVGTKINNLLF